ncbi:helix-turn-helix domain-containing protein [Chloroflexota bacterium]
MSHYQQVRNMLATGEVARLFGVHISTVRRWSKQEIIKAYRIGPRGDRRFRREDVASLLLKRAIQGHLRS